MYTQEIKAQGDKVTITLPDELVDKELKVTIEEIVVDKDRKNKLQKMRAFFRANAVDLSNFKFNRDEANER